MITKLAACRYIFYAPFLLVLRIINVRNDIEIYICSAKLFLKNDIIIFHFISIPVIDFKIV